MLNGPRRLAAATVMDGSALPAIDALPSWDAISKAPRAVGYRGSDFVRWHKPDHFRTAAIPSAIGGLADVAHMLVPLSCQSADPNSMRSLRLL